MSPLVNSRLASGGIPSSRGEREIGKVKACFAQGTHCKSQSGLGVEAECLPSIIHLCTEAPALCPDDNNQDIVFWEALAVTKQWKAYTI